MTRLDTPLAPEARTAKAGLAGQEQGKHKRLGDREERGAAFGALLKTIGTGKTPTETGTPDKAGASPLDALLDDITPNPSGDVAKEPVPLAAEQVVPSSAPSAASTDPSEEA